MDPRVSILKEFPAHSDKVTCVAIGKTTGDILITGGVDKKINLWSPERPNCITSFLGHTSSIAVVQFSPSEDLVGSGSQVGHIKTWDLGCLKASRTLMGHRATIKYMDFYSCSNLLISGSTDSIIKFWDIRKKGAILSCKGHNSAVNVLKFSPSGRWFASGGFDGRVKIWEIRTGQVLHEFVHTCPVTAIAFHPKQPFLAAGSMDNALRFYDLEHLSLVKSVATRGVTRCLVSSNDCNNLYGATDDSLCVYNWNTNVIQDFISTQSRLQDLAVCKNVITGLSTKRNNVAIFTIPLGKVRQFCHEDPLSAGDSVITSLTSVINSNTSDCNSDHNSNKVPEIEIPSAEPEKINRLEAEQPQEQQQQNEEALHPQKDLPRTPRTFRVVKASSNPTPVSLAEKSETHIAITQIDFSVNIRNESGDNISQSAGIISKNCCQGGTSSPEPLDLSTTGVAGVQTDLKKDSFESKFEAFPCWVGGSDSDTKKIQNRNPILCSNSTFDDCRSEKDIVEFASESSEGEDPRNLSLDDTVRSLSHQALSSSTYEHDSLAAMKKLHYPVLNVLKSRQQNMHKLYDWWRNQDIKNGAKMAAKLNDLTTVADFIGILVACRPSRWTLDICVVLLPAIFKLVQSRHGTHVLAGCHGLRSMLKNFSATIRANVASPVETLGVDLTHEERHKKSLTCHDYLVTIRKYLLERPNARGALGQTVKEILGLLSWLEN